MEEKMESHCWGLGPALMCETGVKQIGERQRKICEVLRVKPLAALAMIDEGELDRKIVAILLNDSKTSLVNDCLAHTPKLVDYFLDDYGREINQDNPLGMDGEIALAFGDLLRKLWAPGASPVPPRIFKSKLARFAPQFSGFNQHDSRELLAFLLDGLHEDLNRVKCKPYIEVKDDDGRPDEEVVGEYWHNHLTRNDSIIVDVCQYSQLLREFKLALQVIGPWIMPNGLS
ncbi:hypothetical protein RIF29_24249 [Crotalaria pallida]|uniref:ubiquitinyl hydrolase 1 n=1 Tax=Crotalaria pallida TaxID=3830 RepID=A0AAN9HYA2_CROPI